jgi:cobalt/nickel transport protein
MPARFKNLFARKHVGLWAFVGVALAVAVLLAVFVSPWASSSPDGLEKVAGDKGFLNKAGEKDQAWKNSPMKGYAVPGVKSEKTSTAVSGLVGVAITVVAMLAVAMLAVGLGRLKSRKAMVPPADET